MSSIQTNRSEISAVNPKQAANGGEPVSDSGDGQFQKSPKVYVTGIVILALLGGGLAAIYTHKHTAITDDTTARANDAAAGPFVLTAVASKTAAERKVKVLGETRPYASTTLYGKITGYLSDITVDKGDRVKKGQLMAKIFSPETSQDYTGAVADSRNKAGIADRVRDLHKRKLVSDQEADQAISDAEMSKARLEAASAVKGYEDIRAPFDGTVTARYADPGALLQANSLPIVNVSQTDKLRVTVYLDQRDATYVRLGDAATIQLTERPGVDYTAVVTRQAGELDPRTRTLLTEIELDNRKGEIVAGSFVDVVVTVHAPQFVQMPVDALISVGGKSKVAIVTPQGTIHYQDVGLGENNGETIEVYSGLQGGETLALSLGNNLTEGQHVRVNSSEAKK